MRLGLDPLVSVACVKLYTYIQRSIHFVGHMRATVSRRPPATACEWAQTRRQSSGGHRQRAHSLSAPPRGPEGRGPRQGGGRRPRARGRAGRGAHGAGRHTTRAARACGQTWRGPAVAFARAYACACVSITVSVCLCVFACCRMAVPRRRPAPTSGSACRAADPVAARGRMVGSGAGAPLTKRLAR